MEVLPKAVFLKDKATPQDKNTIKNPAHSTLKADYFYTKYNNDGTHPAVERDKYRKKSRRVLHGLL